MQGFYDALVEQVQNMAIFPDDYTMLEEFLNGLPQVMLARCFREYRLTVEANTLEDWLAAAKDIEVCDQNETYYVGCNKSRTAAAAMPKQPARPKAKDNEKPEPRCWGQGEYKKPKGPPFTKATRKMEGYEKRPSSKP